MSATTTAQATTTPVVGMQYLHERRKDWQGAPLLMQVTSIKGDIVYSRPVRYGYVDKSGNAIKATHKVFAQVVREVTFIPAAKVKAATVRLTDRECEQLFQKAHIAGRRAGDTVGVAAMVVEQHANVMDDSSPVVESWVVADGVCGFAWIKTPGNSSFARWLRKTGRGTTAYQGGTQVWVSEYRQSMTRKAAYAGAFAKVLNDAGVVAYADSRMD